MLREVKENIFIMGMYSFCYHLWHHVSQSSSNSSGTCSKTHQIKSWIPLQALQLLIGPMLEHSWVVEKKESKNCLLL